jgi:hypothetical protein
VSDPSDFNLEPVKVIYQDYTPVQVLRMGWCNEKGTSGRSRKAVVHARCDRNIGKRTKGELLCGYKSKAKYGGDLYPEDTVITCPKCLILSQDLKETMRRSEAYGWGWE